MWGSWTLKMPRLKNRRKSQIRKVKVWIIIMSKNSYITVTTARSSTRADEKNSNHFSDYARRTFLLSSQSIFHWNQRRKKHSCARVFISVWCRKFFVRFGTESLLSENLLIGLVSNFTINSHKIVVSRFACGIRWCSSENRNQPTNCLRCDDANFRLQ